MAKVTPLSAIFISLLPVVVAVFLYQLDRFDPAPYPEHELTQKEPPLFVPKRNSHMLRGSEKIGYGQLPAPEDIAYDAKTGAIYTGCEDGWVSRVVLNASAGDPVVENWVNTGGRPLGIVHGLHGEVIVADADKGLLNISRDGMIELLTDEAEGVKFKLTDAVDIGPDGKLYFTDASYKYSFKEYFLDLLEGRPHGRFLAYDPSTKEQKSWRRCRKYYIEGPRKGTLDTFIEDLPGLPDNIRYDGDGQYWIALSTVRDMIGCGEVVLLVKLPNVNKFKTKQFYTGYVFKTKQFYMPILSTGSLYVGKAKDSKLFFVYWNHNMNYTVSFLVSSERI
ncbi:UNVERIFIED_CONTAM: protein STRICTOSIDINE SYNTHASE-LIKE 5 [Sesamum latifolium]|uniref:Protein STRICTOSIDINE SYNTHASE-LIKE 5 n=1 Tax=Sesamum latifolium TaxID=2727402 RepID=A0AAW2TMD5_9LAMI